jgi:hypothetical protein
MGGVRGRHIDRTQEAGGRRRNQTSAGRAAQSLGGVPLQVHDSRGGGHVGSGKLRGSTSRTQYVSVVKIRDAHVFVKHTVEVRT